MATLAKNTYFRTAAAVLFVFYKILAFIPKAIIRLLVWFLVFLALIALGVALVETLAISPRDIAYRYASPGSSACDIQARNPGLLAAFGNSEDKVRAADAKQGGFECMLQYHSVPVTPDQTWPATDKPMGPIGYHLAFLEFQEDGRAAQTGLNGESLAASQLDVVEAHLKCQRRNYVIVFIHGWRHDARIGDDNVANARLYAAHVASFLDLRCKTLGRDCGVAVTAIFVGWRGARVDERAIESWVNRKFGRLGTTAASTVNWMVGTFPAQLTLFDRKPVSERIAPSAIAEIRHIDWMFKDRVPPIAAPQNDRMIVIGHSLGGNMLATALNETMIDAVRRHVPGELLKPPLGNLVVLLNPASEAWKWTSIQKEMRSRTVFPENSWDTNKEADLSRTFFRPDQPPIYVSVTSAFAWPAAALTNREQKLPGLMRESNENRLLAKYDNATHDFFPLFKGNFQPVAETLERLALWFPTSTEKNAPGFSNQKLCAPFGSYQRNCVRVIVSGLRGIAAVARNIPFANTRSDQTETIGHIDPPRPPYAAYNSIEWQSPLPYGTTHELGINNSIGHPTIYANAGSAYHSECDVVDHWLWQARANKTLEPFEGWDSGLSHVRGGKIVPDRSTPNLTPIRQRPTSNGHLEIQFRQFLYNSGTQPIITRNDPFWNIRALDTTLAFHSGYVGYPLICALNQLVIDDVASEPKPM
jgi:hypothetical protein